MRYFQDSDFDAFEETYAASTDEKVIARRKYVVDNRFKELHKGDEPRDGLQFFFQKYDLHAH